MFGALPRQAIGFDPSKWQVVQPFMRAHADGAVILASLIINVLALALPIVLMQIYDRVIPNQNRATLFALAAGLFGAIAAEVVMRAARSRLMSYSSARYEVDTTLAMFRRLLSADVTEIERVPAGAYANRIAAIDRIREFRGGDAACTILDLPFSILFLLVVAWIAPPIAIVLVCLIVTTIVAVRQLTRASEDAAAERADLEGRRHSFLIEVLNQIETVKSIGISAFMERRYERLMAASATTTAAFTATSTTAQGLIGAASQLTPVIVGSVGAVLVMFNTMTVGALAAAILLSGRAIQPVMRLEALVAGDLNTRRLEEDVDEILDMAPAEYGTADPGPIERIDLKNVSCLPSETGTYRLCHLNLAVACGEVVGIRGANGSGKSTLIALLAGQLHPQEGAVHVNGVDIRTCAPDVIARRIAHLPQQPQLLEGTVLENMTRFRPDIFLDEAIELATALGMNDYFAAHPEGLSMKIRQGVNAGLPTSITDRVALVAALLGQPSLILFDEANPSLDFEGDRLLREHLISQRDHAGVVLITQRPSYLRECDRLYRLEDGRLLPDDGADLVTTAPATGTERSPNAA
ncbi:MAG: ABC transporter transmembrane domain-containing protein [Pseudomonadota bacterium]